MKNTKYIWMVLLAAVLYGTMSSFVKWSYASGFHAAELAFGQALLSAFLLALCTLWSRRRQKERLKIPGKEFIAWLLTGSAIGVTNYFYYRSVHYIPASVAIVILMQFTWFSLLLEWLCFGRKSSKTEITTVLVLLAGTVLAGDLTAAVGRTLSGKGVMLAAMASFTYAVYIVANARTGNRAGWQIKSRFIMVGSALAIFSANAPEIVRGSYLGWEYFGRIVFLAVFGTTIPTALFAVGIPKVGAGTASMLMTVELPVAVLCAHALLNEPVTLWQMVGIALMLGAIIRMNNGTRRQTPSGKEK